MQNEGLCADLAPEPSRGGVWPSQPVARNSSGPRTFRLTLPSQLCDQTITFTSDIIQAC